MLVEVIFFFLLSTMPTNAELSSQFTALQDQLSVLVKNMPTKADIDKLATKDELKSEFDVFKAELRQEMDDRFTKYKEEQAVIIEDLKLRVTKAETALTKKISELDAQRLMDLKYSYRINSLLIGIPEKEGSWKETPDDCQKHVEKVLDMFLPDSSLVQIIDCHRLGSTKPTIGDMTSSGVQKARPIIFKVKDFFQVRYIRDNIDKLKKHFADNPTENKVFIRPHIPKKMLIQKNSLQPKFKELFDAGLKPKWVLDRKSAVYSIVTENNQSASHETDFVSH